MARHIRMIRVAFVTALAALLLVGCGGEDAPQTATAADEGGSITVAVGEPFRIELAGNPTTGFEWAVESIDGSAQLGEPTVEYVADETDEQVAGSGGVYTFVFTPETAGRSTVTLAYARSFEDEPPAETYTLDVEVSE